MHAPGRIIYDKVPLFQNINIVFHHHYVDTHGRPDGLGIQLWKDITVLEGSSFPNMSEQTWRDDTVSSL